MPTPPSNPSGAVPTSSGRDRYANRRMACIVGAVLALLMVAIYVPWWGGGSVWRRLHHNAMPLAVAMSEERYAPVPGPASPSATRLSEAMGAIVVDAGPFTTTIAEAVTPRRCSWPAPERPPRWTSRVRDDVVHMALRRLR